MDRTQLIIIIAMSLFFAFLLGWILAWLYGKMNRINGSNMEEIDDLANKLHDAERQKDEAIQSLHHSQHKLKNEVSQAKAELNAAMDGLGVARRETESLRQILENKF